MLLFSSSKHVFIFGLLIAAVSSEDETDTERNHHRNATDLPSKSDIWKYVNSLEKILNFSIRNKYEIDLNLYFGLFLVNVNLKPIVKEKSGSLPSDLRLKVNGLVKKSNYIGKFFDQMIRQDTSKEDQKNKMIYTLMNKEDEWLDRMKRFRVDTWKLQKLTPSQQDHKFSTWNKYVKNIMNLENWLPSPKQSDMCLVSLAKNPNKNTDTLTKCEVDEICYIILLHGNDFGYALTHRLVLLIMARLGRGCYLFTPELDTELTKRICSTIYAEASFIAQNNYSMAADLLFEQMILCILEGQTQFLEKEWLSYILELQTPNGCLSVNLSERVKAEKSLKLKKRSKKKYIKWKILKTLDSQEIMGEYCNSHITGVAAALVAAAIKYFSQH